MINSQDYQLKMACLLLLIMGAVFAVDAGIDPEAIILMTAGLFSGINFAFSIMKGI